VRLKALGAALLFSTTALAQTPPADAPKTSTPEGAGAAPQAAPAPPPVTPAPPSAQIVAPVTPAAPAAPAAPAFTFALKGFVSMSAAWQNGGYFLSEGQQSLSATTPASPFIDKNSLTFDVRQSRFNFSVKGPQVLHGATPSAVLELDFFQGFGGGNFGDVSLLNRMRTAYSELSWANGTQRVQLGQQNDLIFAMAPTSLSHIGFPLGYFTGNLGWRRPGIFGFHNFAVNKDAKVEVAWEVGRSQWADAAATIGGASVDPALGGTTAAGGSQALGISRGEASGLPAVEGRVTFTWGKLFNVWGAAHYNQVDLTGVGGVSNAAPRTLNVNSYHVGAKLVYAGLTLAATGFTGQNVSPLIGQFIDFKIGPASNPDVETTGYWAQAGYNLTKEFSVWGFYGNQKPKKADAERAGLARIENTTTNVIAMYRDGGYGLSGEWINFQTKNATYTSGLISSTRTSKADQFMLTANYFF